MKNPPWSKDELILALELYLRDRSSIGNNNHPEVLKLSVLLNTLPSVIGHHMASNFRNPNAVAMKLSNFLRFDPNYEGNGLLRGNILEKEVWETYSQQPEELISLKNTIINNIDYLKEQPENEWDDVITEALEGKLLTKVHLVRERNKKIVENKKNRVLKITGALKCEVCTFDFKDTYGELGDGFAECHHTKPVSHLLPNEKTKLEDLAIVCANCHRMIHRTKPWKTINELKNILNK
jgi:5-methylcytosine-specific restriction protein A